MTVNTPPAPRLAEVYAAGNVRRWHANPMMSQFVQTNADHQGRCVQLAILIFNNLEPSLSHAQFAWLLAALAVHDVAERRVGDLPYDFKIGFPEVAEAHAAAESAAESAALRAMIGFDTGMVPVMRDHIKLIDRLEALCFALLHAPREVARFQAGWAAARRDVLDRATALGVREPVAGLLHDLEAGDW